MPGNENQDKGEVEKTLGLVAIANLLVSPLYWANEKLGLAASLVATAAVLKKCYDEGAANRPRNSFWKSSSAGSADNIGRTITAGAVTIVDNALAPKSP